jgi:hypothetical protein
MVLSSGDRRGAVGLLFSPARRNPEALLSTLNNALRSYLWLILPATTPQNSKVNP